LEHDPWPRDDQRYATKLGIALVAQDKSDESFRVHFRAGGPAAAHANLGYILAANGRRAEAADAYHKALALQPNLPVAEVALAQLSKPDTDVASLPPVPTDLAVTRASVPSR
jgi:Flp pilus assembly protein TadD